MRLALCLALLAAPLAAQPVRLRANVAGADVALDVPRMPARVDATAARLAPLLRWSELQPGLALTTISLRAGPLGLSVDAIVVRVDPARFRFALQHRVGENGMTGTWTVDSAGAGAVLAMNAGQFKETGPWGWLVTAGEEQRIPLRAPLGIGIRIDTMGRMRWVPPGAERSVRHDAATAWAFQSFPLLFFDGRVPPTLRDSAVVDLGHRDARLIMMEARDGTPLFLITRYVGVGTMGQRVPIGLTTPEAVVLAASLGARHAVMLDGGISGQLLVRDASGGETSWHGLRKVPLGLVAEPRARH